MQKKTRDHDNVFKTTVRNMGYWSCVFPDGQSVDYVSDNMILCLRKTISWKKTVSIYPFLYSKV